MKRKRTEVSTLSDEDTATACIEVVATLYKKHSLVRTDEGWLAPVDWHLNSESSLQPSSIQQIVDGLSPTRIETYIGETYSTLDQLLQLSARYDELRRQITALAIDRLEEEGREAIQDQDVANGYLDIESRVAESESASQEVWATAAEASAAVLQTMQTDPAYAAVLSFDPQFVAHSRATATTGTLYSTYRSVHARETPDKANVDNDTIYVSDPWNVQVPPLPFGRTPAIYEDPGQTTGLLSLRHLQYRVTYNQACLEAYTQKTQLVSQGTLSVGLAGSARHSATAKKAWADWKKLEVGSRAEHLRLLKLVNEVKRKAADDPGGPTELGLELSRLRALFVAKLVETTAKLQCSIQSVQRMFCTAVPAPPLVAGWNDRDGSYLTAFALWFQKFRGLLERALGLDGSMLVSVSLASLLGTRFARELQAVKAAGGDKLTFQFELPSSFFDGYEALRIAGISAYAVMSKGARSGPWSARVRPPLNAVNLENGAPTPQFRQPERWSDLGRIVGRSSPRPPDVNGLAILRNLQPMSPPGQTGPDDQWLLIMKRRSLSGEDGCNLADLQLDIIINARSR